MGNLHLFELINAAPGLAGWPLLTARALAQWPIWLLLLAMTVAWVRGSHGARRELLQMLLSAAIALALSQVVSHAWPHARPFALHLGNQYLAHAADPGLPSDHVTALWSLAMAALMTRHFELWALPLMAAGLIVGWSRVYLGVHFPFDIIAALPVAMLGAIAARVLRRPSMPLAARLLYLYHCLEKSIRSLLLPTHQGDAE